MDERTRIFHYALASIGVHFFAKENWNSKLKLAHQIFNCFIALFTFIFTSGFVVNSSNIVTWIEGMCIWTTGDIVFMSVAVTLFFRNKFRSFLEEMAFKDIMTEMPFIDYVLKSSHEGKLKELKELVIDSQNILLKYSRLLLMGYSCAVTSTAALYIIDAIFQMIVREDQSLRLLAFEMWFPWSLEDINVYIASFIFHAYAGFFSSMVYPSVQSTIVLLIGQLIRQLRVLTFILVHLDDLMLELHHERDEQWQRNCTELLAQCVDHYVKIKKFSNRLNAICRPFYLALILVAIMLVCVCSVKIAISNKLSLDLLKYYMHEFFFILMVMLFCCLGQQVQNECEKLEEAVTEKWYIFNKSHVTNVRIFQMALGQKMPIFIFGTITLSLPTFTWFLKTGMSFFTLVMSVLEE